MASLFGGPSPAMSLHVLFVNPASSYRTLALVATASPLCLWQLHSLRSLVFLPISLSQDKMLEGRSITIKKGAHRGMRGRIISATATHVRLELEAQMKTVTVDRCVCVWTSTNMCFLCTHVQCLCLCLCVLGMPCAM